MIYGDSNSENNPNLTSIMQSSNLYLYCINDSIIFFDSTGKAVEIMHYKNPDRVYGHVDIAINGTIYSYAAYGYSSATLLGEGSIMVVDKNNYINVRILNGDVITGFVIKTTQKQEENLSKVLNSYIEGVEPYYLDDDKYNGTYYNGKWKDNLAIYSALNNGGLNCVAFTGKSLSEANIYIQTLSHILNQNVLSLPKLVKSTLMNSYNNSLNQSFYGSVIEVISYEKASSIKPSNPIFSPTLHLM